MLNNKQLMESLPELPSLVKDKSEQFLSAAGVAFTKVCQPPDFHTLSSNTYYCKNTNIILFDNPTVWKITLALWFESLFSLILFVIWGERWLTFKSPALSCQVLDDRQTTAATADGYIQEVPFTHIRLRNIGSPVPFSNLKASYYG